ncbi:sugar kinase [Thalassotalea litorea]|uniref:2-dehydro-3-deoxygluconokinase n=1 Tax=Thalassotalea litorea TaxID=2020715 RepID=A0A5R9IJL0_9GAMM|nr:sugar kinase [Thalassotalea litorea]TLU65740.1 sugar kinase [Thalassotalea litorea]
MEVAILGECMVELSQQPDGHYKMGFGGDTLNTAIYLSRSGGRCDYFTAIGDDLYSAQMKAEWQKEGVGVNNVITRAGANSGLYIIENDDHGERHFHYWRDTAPARELLTIAPDIFTILMDYPLLFLTGITLSIYSDADRETLFAFLKRYRLNGGRVVFDNNYRPRNWHSQADAIHAYQSMMENTDIALISLEDEIALYGEHQVEACMERWISKGVCELVVKNGEQGCTAYHQQQYVFVPLPNVVKPLDTTAAGDSFNGAYLAARMQGKPLEGCITDAQHCAGVVIMHKGAIIDKGIPLQPGDLA